MKVLRNILISLVIPFAAVAQEPESLPAPSLVFPDGATVDVGTVDRDVALVDSIRITNSGDAPLTIYSAFADCTCTKIDYPREDIAPGDTISLRVHFDTKGRYGGGFLKMIRLRTNDPSGQKNVYVKGEIRIPPRRD